LLDFVDIIIADHIAFRVIGPQIRRGPADNRHQGDKVVLDGPQGLIGQGEFIYRQLRDGGFRAQKQGGGYPYFIRPGIVFITGQKALPYRVFNFPTVHNHLKKMQSALKN
jgi:hypothetical protein